MTALDVLRTMRESLATLLQMQPEELRSLFTAGYSTDPPMNYRQQTPEQWAAADLAWIAEAAQTITNALNPEPTRVNARETSDPGVVEPDATQE